MRASLKDTWRTAQSGMLDISPMISRDLVDAPVHVMMSCQIQSCIPLAAGAAAAMGNHAVAAAAVTGSHA